MLINSLKHSAITVLLLCSHGCLDFCRNQVLNETRSPDNGKRAVVFERDCGATTGFSTQISILPATKYLPREAGNVFIEESVHGVATTVRVRWDSPQRVVITYPGHARIFRKEVLVKGVAIAYEPQ
jgi:hypothetical protein